MAGRGRRRRRPPSPCGMTLASTSLHPGHRDGLAGVSVAKGTRLMAGHA